MTIAQEPELHELTGIPSELLAHRKAWIARTSLQRHPPFESLDRFATTEMRTSTTPAGVVAAFYDLARDLVSPPISFQIACAVLDKPAGKALLITGLVDPPRYPQGEVDGPLGSVALARALHLLGHEVTIIVEDEVIPPMRDLLATAVLPAVSLQAADLPDTEAARAFGRQFDIVIAVEKLGRNTRGRRHLLDGSRVHGGDLYADDYVQAAREAGATTVGIGDNGNEIGFGNIAVEAEQLTPVKSEIEGGFFAATRVDYFFPASVSNFGCYAVVAALAIGSRREELSLSGNEITLWLNSALDAGLRSGGIDDAQFRGDDGVPTRYVAATAEVFKGIVHQALVSI